MTAGERRAIEQSVREFQRGESSEGRHFMEMSVAVLITAEIIAKVYYAALRDATGSVILDRLCEQILRDEASHVQFQSEQLATKLRARRGRWLYRLTIAAQRMLFLGTCIVVWAFQRRAFAAAGQTFWRFWRDAWLHFEGAFAIDV